jgi:hypothetical protein
VALIPVRDSANARRAGVMLLPPAIRATVALLAVALAPGGCRGPVPHPPAAGATVADPASRPTMPHGDHNPHHGGVVMMKGELHYEVVFDPAGRSHQLFFSDAAREDLPASFASSAALTIHRPDGTEEAIPLQIDAAGESWTGAGRPVVTPEKASVRVAFTIKGEPYWIDLPFATPAAAPDR